MAVLSKICLKTNNRLTPVTVRQRPQSEDTDNDVTIAASSYALSGVGWGLSPGNARAPPPSYDARTLHREQLIEQVNDDHDRVVPYRSRYVPVPIV